MTDLMLKLETVADKTVVDISCFAGTHIARACMQATRVATLLGVIVHFDFNGVPCYARPGSDWRTLQARWQEIFDIPEDKRQRHVMAWSDVPPETVGAPQK